MPPKLLPSLQTPPKSPAGPFKPDQNAVDRPDLFSVPMDVIYGLLGMDANSTGRQQKGKSAKLSSPNAIAQVLSAMLPLVSTSRLAMNAEATAARAAEQGFTKDVYHGTRGNFDEFDPARMDLGIHVAHIPETAENALNTGYITKTAAITPGDPRINEKILPLKARMRKTIQLPDIGLWRSPHSWRTKLAGGQINQEGELIKPYQLRQAVLSEISDPITAQALLDAAMSPKYKYQGPDTHAEWASDVRHILQQAGYDSIKYRNTIEGNGEMSSLLLYPNQVRSKFAAFDPAKGRSGNLLATLAGTAVAGTAAAQMKKKKGEQ